MTEINNIGSDNLFTKPTREAIREFAKEDKVVAQRITYFWNVYKQRKQAGFHDVLGTELVSGITGELPSGLDILEENVLKVFENVFEEFTNVIKANRPVNVSNEKLTLGYITPEISLLAGNLESVLKKTEGYTIDIKKSMEKARTIAAAQNLSAVEKIEQINEIYRQILNQNPLAGGRIYAHIPILGTTVQRVNAITANRPVLSARDFLRVVREGITTDTVSAQLEKIIDTLAASKEYLPNFFPVEVSFNFRKDLRLSNITAGINIQAATEEDVRRALSRFERNVNTIAVSLRNSEDIMALREAYEHIIKVDENVFALERELATSAVFNTGDVHAYVYNMLERFKDSPYEEDTVSNAVAEVYRQIENLEKILHESSVKGIPRTSGTGDIINAIVEEYVRDILGNEPVTPASWEKWTNVERLSKEEREQLYKTRPWKEYLRSWSSPDELPDEEQSRRFTQLAESLERVKEKGEAAKLKGFAQLFDIAEVDKDTAQVVLQSKGVNEVVLDFSRLSTAEIGELANTLRRATSEFVTKRKKTSDKEVYTWAKEDIGEFIRALQREEEGVIFATLGNRTDNGITMARKALQDVITSYLVTKRVNGKVVGHANERLLAILQNRAPWLFNDEMMAEEAIQNLNLTMLEYVRDLTKVNINDLGDDVIQMFDVTAFMNRFWKNYFKYTKRSSSSLGQYFVNTTLKTLSGYGVIPAPGSKNWDSKHAYAHVAAVRERFLRAYDALEPVKQKKVQSVYEAIRNLKGPGLLQEIERAVTDPDSGAPTFSLDIMKELADNAEDAEYLIRGNLERMVDELSQVYGGDVEELRRALIPLDDSTEPGEVVTRVETLLERLGGEKGVSNAREAMARYTASLTRLERELTAQIRDLAAKRDEMRSNMRLRNRSEYARFSDEYNRVMVKLDIAHRRRDLVREQLQLLRDNYTIAQTGREMLTEYETEEVVLRKIDELLNSNNRLIKVSEKQVLELLGFMASHPDYSGLAKRINLAVETGDRQVPVRIEKGRYGEILLRNQYSGELYAFGRDTTIRVPVSIFDEIAKITTRPVAVTAAGEEVVQTSIPRGIGRLSLQDIGAMGSEIDVPPSQVIESFRNLNDLLDSNNPVRSAIVFDIETTGLPDRMSDRLRKLFYPLELSYQEVVNEGGRLVPRGEPKNIRIAVPEKILQRIEGVARRIGRKASFDLDSEEAWLLRNVAKYSPEAKRRWGFDTKVLTGEASAEILQAELVADALRAVEELRKLKSEKMAVRIGTAIKQLSEAMARSNTHFLVAHNALRADIPWLQMFIPKNMAQEVRQRIEGARVIDTLFLSRYVYPHLSRHRLSDLVAIVAESDDQIRKAYLNQAHSADIDTRALASVFARLAQDYTAAGPFDTRPIEIGDRLVKLAGDATDAIVKDVYTVNRIQQVEGGLELILQNDYGDEEIVRAADMENLIQKIAGRYAYIPDGWESWARVFEQERLSRYMARVIGREAGDPIEQYRQTRIRAAMAAYRQRTGAAGTIELPLINMITTIAQEIQQAAVEAKHRNTLSLLTEEILGHHEYRLLHENLTRFTPETISSLQTPFRSNRHLQEMSKLYEWFNDPLTRVREQLYDRLDVLRQLGLIDQTHVAGAIEEYNAAEERMLQEAVERGLATKPPAISGVDVRRLTIDVGGNIGTMEATLNFASPELVEKDLWGVVGRIMQDRELVPFKNDAGLLFSESERQTRAINAILVPALRKSGVITAGAGDTLTIRDVVRQLMAVRETLERVELHEIVPLSQLFTSSAVLTASTVQMEAEVNRIVDNMLQRIGIGNREQVIRYVNNVLNAREEAISRFIGNLNRGRETAAEIAGEELDVLRQLMLPSKNAVPFLIEPQYYSARRFTPADLRTVSTGELATRFAELSRSREGRDVEELQRTLRELYLRASPDARRYEYNRITPEEMQKLGLHDALEAQEALGLAIREGNAYRSPISLEWGDVIVPFWRGERSYVRLHELDWSELTALAERTSGKNPYLHRAVREYLDYTGRDTGALFDALRESMARERSILSTAIGEEPVRIAAESSRAAVVAAETAATGIASDSASREASAVVSSITRDTIERGQAAAVARKMEQEGLFSKIVSMAAGLSSGAKLALGGAFALAATGLILSRKDGNTLKPPGDTDTAAPPAPQVQVTQSRTYVSNEDEGSIQAGARIVITGKGDIDEATVHEAVKRSIPFEVNINMKTTDARQPVDKRWAESLIAEFIKNGYVQ